MLAFRLGVGAIVQPEAFASSHSHTLTTRILGRANKRKRGEADGKHTHSSSELDEEEESRAGAIKRKARPNPFTMPSKASVNGAPAFSITPGNAPAPLKLQPSNLADKAAQHQDDSPSPTSPKKRKKQKQKGVRDSGTVPDSFVRTVNVLPDEAPSKSHTRLCLPDDLTIDVSGSQLYQSSIFSSRRGISIFNNGRFVTPTGSQNGKCSQPRRPGPSGRHR
jgi:hypothetical protein